MESFFGQQLAVRRAVTFAIGTHRAGTASLPAEARDAMASLLFGTSPLDPMSYGVVSIGLIAIAGQASYVPVRSATTIDPVLALRGE